MDSPANGISTGLPGPLSERGPGCSDELDHDKPIKPENKAQNVSQSRPHIRIQNSKMATKVMKTATTYRKKTTKPRRPWSDTEIETLLGLLSEHGTSWKELKERDVKDVLKSRDQTSLRNKARNMKMDYLKAELRPPPFLENIAITQIQVATLAELGITYDQGAGFPSKTKGIKEE